VSYISVISHLEFCLHLNNIFNDGSPWREVLSPVALPGRAAVLKLKPFLPSMLRFPAHLASCRFGPKFSGQSFLTQRLFFTA
jgi:hypothetical protein